MALINRKLKKTKVVAKGGSYSSIENTVGVTVFSIEE